MIKAKIVYTSMTGNTTQIAYAVDQYFQELGITTEVIECDWKISPQIFNDCDICIIATYTYGDGELPFEFIDFYEDLKEIDLTGKIYGVVGTGDMVYEFFAVAVDQFEEAFEQTKAIKGANHVKIENDPEDEDKVLLKEFVNQVVKTYKEHNS